MVGVLESLRPRQMVILQEKFTKAARSCARIYLTPGKVSGTERDGPTPGDASYSKVNTILSLNIPIFFVTSVSPAQFRDQDIFNPRHPSSIIKRDRNPKPLNAHINASPVKNSDSTSFCTMLFVESVRCR